MRSMKLVFATAVIITAVALIILTALIASAQTPQLINYQAVARNSAQVVVPGLQRRDAWTEMVIADRFADVELVDLDAV